MRTGKRLSTVISAVIIATIVSGIMIQSAGASFSWSGANTLSQTSWENNAVAYDASTSTTYIAHGAGTSCCPDMALLSSTNLASWSNIGTLTGARQNPGKVGLAYNPADQKLYMAFGTTGEVFSFTEACPEEPCEAVAPVPVIGVSSSSDGRTWTIPTNVTFDPANINNPDPPGAYDSVGPSITFDPNNNRLLVAFATVTASNNLEVLLYQSAGPNFNQVWSQVGQNPITYGGSQLSVLTTPDLKFINGELYMAYVASDKTIHVIRSTDGITWTNKGDILGQTAYFVAIDYSSVENLFHLTWVGTDFFWTMNDMSSYDGISWGSHVIFDGNNGSPKAESQHFPSLAFASSQNSLVLGFTGTDGAGVNAFCPCSEGHLNVMQYRSVPTLRLGTSPSSVQVFCSYYTGCNSTESALIITSLNNFGGSVSLTYSGPQHGPYVTGPSSATVSSGGQSFVDIVAHPGGTKGGIYVWTITGTLDGYTTSTTLTITYDYCYGCRTQTH